MYNEEKMKLCWCECIGGIMKRIVGLSIIFALSSTLVMANVTVPELANAIQVGDENKVTQSLVEG